jgi:hypothetical protein
MLAEAVGTTNFTGLVADLALAKNAVRLAFTSLLMTKGNET